jgi:hypothetical protein
MTLETHLEDPQHPQGTLALWPQAPRPLKGQARGHPTPPVRHQTAEAKFVGSSDFDQVPLKVLMHVFFSVWGR